MRDDMAVTGCRCDLFDQPNREREVANKRYSE